MNRWSVDLVETQKGKGISSGFTRLRVTYSIGLDPREHRTISLTMYFPGIVFLGLQITMRGCYRCFYWGYLRAKSINTLARILQDWEYGRELPEYGLSGRVIRADDGILVYRGRGAATLGDNSDVSHWFGRGFLPCPLIQHGNKREIDRVDAYPESHSCWLPILFPTERSLQISIGGESKYIISCFFFFYAFPISQYHYQTPANLIKHEIFKTFFTRVEGDSAVWCQALGIRWESYSYVNIFMYSILYGSARTS